MSPVPLQSYPIGGKIRDNNQQPISGVTVSLINTTTQEELGSADQATTNVNGEYIVNLENLNTYTDGDSYEIFSTKNGYEKGIMSRVTGTVDLDKGGESDKDMYLETKDYKVIGSVRDFFNLSRKKQTFMVWVNAKTLSGSAEVLVSGGGGRGRGYTTSGNPVINLESSQVVYVEQISMKLSTASDNVTLEIVKCASADGAGTATAVSPMYYIETGTVAQDRPYTIKFANPIRVEYAADGALSIGMKVNGNDGSAILYSSMEGYLLEE